jgi:hypothetical protein
MTVAAVGAGTVGGVLLRRRQQRMRNALAALQQEVAAPTVGDAPFTPPPQGDAAHAPGHKHLGPPVAPRQPDHSQVQDAPHPGTGGVPPMRG